MAVLEEQNKSKDELQKKEQKIAELKNELTVKDKEAQTREQNLKEKYDLQLQEKQTQIDYYKDLKTRLSTKGFLFFSSINPVNGFRGFRLIIFGII